MEGMLSECFSNPFQQTQLTASKAAAAAAAKEQLCKRNNIQ
jgi:hypothetical protein